MTSTEDRDPEYGGGVFFIPEEAPPDELGVTTEQAARALAHVALTRSRPPSFSAIVSPTGM